MSRRLLFILSLALFLFGGCHCPDDFVFTNGQFQPNPGNPNDPTLGRLRLIYDVGQGGILPRIPEAVASVRVQVVNSSDVVIADVTQPVTEQSVFGNLEFGNYRVRVEFLDSSSLLIGYIDRFVEIPSPEEVTLIIDLLLVGQPPANFPVYPSSGSETVLSAIGFLQTPSQIETGTDFEAVVVALNGFNEKLTGHSGPIILSSLSGGTLSGTLNLSFTDGTASFGPLLYAGPDPLTLRATAGVLTADSLPIPVITSTFSINLLAPRAYAIGSRAQKAADLNGDGFLDLIVVGTDPVLAGPGLQIRLNDGTGVFDDVSRFALDTNPGGVDFADVDGDGDLDIAATNTTSPASIQIFLNNGDGTFTTGANIASTNFLTAVVFGHFNGDTNIDVAAGNSLAPTSLLVSLGAGDGSFGALTETGGNPLPLSLIGGDFDEDDVTDIVSRTNTNAIAVHLGVGDGTFGVPIELTTPNARPHAAIVDLNEDEDLDIVGGSGTTLSFFAGNGNGTFDARVDFALTDNILSVETGDFDGDDNPDVFVETDGPELIVFFGDGTGALTPTPLPAMANTVSVVVADLNNDGLDDAVEANLFFLNVRFSDGTEVTPISETTLVPQNRPVESVVGDFDEDTNLDLITVNNFSTSVSLFLGDGTGGFSAATNISTVSSGPLGIEAGDLNLDEDLDLLIGSSFFADIRVLFGDATGAFPTNIALTPPSSVQDVRIGDFNGDTRPDIISSNTAGSVSVFLQDSVVDGTFGAAITTAVATTPEIVRIGNLNEDNNLDFVTINDSILGYTVGLGDGTGNFTTTEVVLGETVRSLALDDLNGDGDLDLAIGTSSDSRLNLFFGDGMGSFVPQPAILAPNIGRALESVDFNADGFPELVAGGPYVRLFVNQGDGTFESFGYAVDDQPRGFAFGDFDKDGGLEFVVSNLVINLTRIIKVVTSP